MFDKSAISVIFQNVSDDNDCSIMVSATKTIRADFYILLNMNRKLEEHMPKNTYIQGEFAQTTNHNDSACDATEKIRKIIDTELTKFRSTLFAKVIDISRSKPVHDEELFPKPIAGKNQDTQESLGKRVARVRFGQLYPSSNPLSADSVRELYNQDPKSYQWAGDVLKEARRQNIRHLDPMIYATCLLDMFWQDPAMAKKFHEVFCQGSDCKEDSAATAARRFFYSYLEHTPEYTTKCLMKAWRLFCHRVPNVQRIRVRNVRS